MPLFSLLTISHSLTIILAVSRASQKRKIKNEQGGIVIKGRKSYSNEAEGICSRAVSVRGHKRRETACLLRSVIAAGESGSRVYGRISPRRAALVVWGILNGPERRQ